VNGYRKAAATATPMTAPTAIAVSKPTGHATSRAAVRVLATAQMTKVLDNGYLLSPRERKAYDDPDGDAS
jgi:hypothetical protein